VIQPTVMVADRPHLRLVPDLLWEVVQARRSQVRVNYAGKGDGAPGQRTRHPFAGLLFCAVCGHRMVDAGGSSSRYYRCSAASSGGACVNTQLLRETPFSKRPSPS
jgi:Recombinase zinc beta ribbon domain